MLAHAAVLLTPSMSLRPPQWPSYKQNDKATSILRILFQVPYPVSPLLATYENCRGMYQQFPLRNSCPIVPPSLLSITYKMLILHCNSFVLIFMHGMGVCVPPFVPIQKTMPGYLLMSSFASRRFSSGCKNGFVASGAPLIACVISLAAVGKSPVFDEMRASARWLIQ